jgi:hypothetical protein
MERFRDGLRQVLSVPKSELKRMAGGHGLGAYPNRDEGAPGPSLLGTGDGKSNNLTPDGNKIGVSSQVIGGHDTYSQQF